MAVFCFFRFFNAAGRPSGKASVLESFLERNRSNIEQGCQLVTLCHPDLTYIFLFLTFGHSGGQP